MNRNEAIEFLKRNEWGTAVEGWSLAEVSSYYWNGLDVVITRSDLSGSAESLQSRIETLLDMKFETEEKLLETIGSLWGFSDIRIDNRTDCQVSHRSLPDGAIEVQVTPAPAKPMPKLARQLQVDIGQLLCLEFDTENELFEHLAEMKVRAQEFGQVMTLLTNEGVIRFDESDILAAVRRLVKPEPQQKTYWDGAEPLRVGHIVQGGTVSAVAKPEYCVFTDDGLEIWEQTAFEPHPFAKYTDEQREFLQAQVEAGVIKLC